MTKVVTNQTMELVFTYVSSSLTRHYPTLRIPSASGRFRDSGTGTTNQLGYYAAYGTTLSPLTPCTNPRPSRPTAANAAISSSSTITETSETASFTAAAGGFYAISGSAAVTATLPTAAGIAGQTVRIRCVAAYTGLCTITPQSGQTIGGQASRIIFAGESPVSKSDGTNQSGQAESSRARAE